MSGSEGVPYGHADAVCFRLSERSSFDYQRSRGALCSWRTKCFWQKKSGDGFKIEITASFKNDGDLRLEGYDFGPAVEAVYRDLDFEYWVDVKKEHLAKLVLELLKEKYSDDLKAVQHFREFCETHQIEHEFMCWR